MFRSFIFLFFQKERIEQSDLMEMRKFIKIEIHKGNVFPHRLCVQVQSHLQFYFQAPKKIKFMQQTLPRHCVFKILAQVRWPNCFPGTKRVPCTTALEDSSVSWEGRPLLHASPSLYNPISILQNPREGGKRRRKGYASFLALSVHVLFPFIYFRISQCYLFNSKELFQLLNNPFLLHDLECFQVLECI